jgi:hypothetical protein
MHVCENFLQNELNYREVAIIISSWESYFNTIARRRFPTSVHLSPYNFKQENMSKTRIEVYTILLKNFVTDTLSSDE